MTLTFQPEPLPVASDIAKLAIWVFRVCADPFSVRAGRFGTSGPVLNVSDPAVTANWVVSFEVAATTRGGSVSSAATATEAASRLRLFERSGIGIPSP